MDRKWIGAIVLIIIGIVALAVGIDWLVTPIHKLPTFLLGHSHRHGHYQKRAYALFVVAAVAFGLGGYLIYRTRAGSTSAHGPSAGVGTEVQPVTASSVLSEPEGTDGSTPVS